MSVDPVEITLDANTLTLDDLEVIEEKLGEPAQDFFTRVSQPDYKPLAKELRVTVLLSLRRTNPNATWEDAGRVAISALTYPDAEKEEKAADPEPAAVA